LGWMLAVMLIVSVLASRGASAQTPTLNALVTFNGTNGSIPEDVGSLAADVNGNLFGTTTGLFTAGHGTVFEVKVDSSTATGYATTPTTLVSFNGANGATPIGGLIADAHGNLFGTTSAGGVHNNGTVFEVKVDSTTATGYATTPTTLVNFANVADAFAGLIMDASGNLFGTSFLGGTTVYFGTVYEVKVDSTTATGYASTATVLVSFNQANGQYPNGTLILDPNGDLLGTTSFGGANYSCPPVGLCGTVFEIKTDSTTATGYANTPTVLASFNGADGGYPEGSLMADAHGNLFGTTYAGGPFFACSDGCGTVFELKTDSTTATGYASTPITLVSFNSTDGQGPVAGLIADANGSLFGSTSGLCALPALVQPTCPTKYGTIFAIKTDSTTGTGYASTPTTLITFTAANGAFPVAMLIADVHGNLFGTAYAGGTLSSGAFGSGEVFEVTGSGFVPPLSFAGTPGTPNCHGVSISTLAQTYGGIDHAAMSLGYPSVAALQYAVRAFCGN